MPVLQVQGTGRPVELAYDLISGEQDAPCLIYAHGLFSSRKGFRAEMIRRWCEKKGWPFLGFDFRGRGDSSGTHRDITLTRHLEDLDAILRVLPEGTLPVLFGSSLGGLASAWFAALNPDRVAACALVAPAFSIVANLLVEAGPENARRWKRQGTLRFQNDRMDLELSHEIVEDAGDYPDALLHSAYRTPTLVAHGMQDAVIPYQRSVAFAESVEPGLVDLHLFADGDHQIHGCMPDVMDLLERFVTRRFGGGEEAMMGEG
jgi:pimeloyl-ACP methyl ester carboxylesterase